MPHPPQDQLTPDHLLELAGEFRAMAMAATTTAVINAFNALAVLASLRYMPRST